MKSKKEVIARGPTGNEGEWIRPMEPPWAGAQRAAPLKGGQGQNHGALWSVHVAKWLSTGAGGKEARFSGKTESQKLQTERYEAPKADVWDLLSPSPPCAQDTVTTWQVPRQKSRGVFSGETAWSSPSSPEKKISKFWEPRGYQNYIQRRQKAPPRFQRYFRMLYSETWSDS